ncbi:MAG: CaiB/BaiF CoA transferase family protein [Pseudomonadales bacterium]
MTHPLKGIKVLDLSRVLAGPFAGRMLSDLGADVVKLEPPEGDVTRLWGKKVGGISGYYNQQNAGKRNMSIDLRKQPGVDLVKTLVQKADVLIENFRPDVMGRLGLDYETLSAINPRLIMLSISGFGANNPDSRRAAYAPVVHAEIGLIERQSLISQAFPADIAVSVADTNASLHGLIGLLAVLFARETSGLGDHIDLAMVDASVVTNDGMNYALDRVKHIVSNEVYETSAGKLILAGDFKFIWHQLHTFFALEDGLDKSGAPSLEEKITARRAAAAHFFNETCGDRDAVVAALNKMNIAWGDVRKASDVEQLASVQARGTIAQVDDRAGGTRSIPQSPYRFRRHQSSVASGAPHLGEHNREVLEDWLGWSSSDILAVEDALVTQSANGAQGA